MNNTSKMDLGKFLGFDRDGSPLWGIAMPEYDPNTDWGDQVEKPSGTSKMPGTAKPAGTGKPAGMTSVPKAS